MWVKVGKLYAAGARHAGFFPADSR